MKHIYGPLHSRRLGLSLGVNLTPFKICSFDCVYCQLGKTSEKTVERKEYVNTVEILEEVKLWLQNSPQDAKSVSYITFSGAGEPTLNINIGSLIAQIKKITPIPIAVITNSSFLKDPALRRELLDADVIVPTLNTADQAAFEVLNRPCEGIKIEEVIQGLVDLRREYKGKIWLEIMIVKGINDDLDGAQKLAEAVERIYPNAIHLNSPVRAPNESTAQSADEKRLKKIQKILGDRCEIV
ncbi:MAG: radical SAM protein [Candidatus Omnitrophota bacterium]|jgi:wyosine [tRNA(Phe)-imidazoG37] synthetase (radical SAM superfamily)